MARRVAGCEFCFGFQSSGEFLSAPQGPDRVASKPPLPGSHRSLGLPPGRNMSSTCSAFLNKKWGMHKHMTWQHTDENDGGQCRELMEHTADRARAHVQLRGSSYCLAGLVCPQPLKAHSLRGLSTAENR